MKHPLLNIQLLTTVFICFRIDAVFADLPPNTAANGVAYLTYDRAAWATVAPRADYYDIHGNDLGTSAASADLVGRRWMFPDRFEGTNWVSAAYPSSYLTPLPDPSLEQPFGGFILPVNSYGTNSFATNHAITSYNSTTNATGSIGLGGSFRATSDFNEPGASVWWEHLALAQDPADHIWKLYATSGPGKGSLFELRNVVTETINGSLHLYGDYVFGNTDWLQFFQDNNGHLDTNLILGHIELIPDGVAKLFAGQAIIDYDETTWGTLASGIGPTPVLTLSAYFDQAQASALGQSNLLHDLQAAYSYTNQIYALNDRVVTNLPSRFTQPTTFVYQRGSLTNQTGSIGLGGVARFSVFGGAGGNLLYGDYTLQFDAGRMARGGTGWYLIGNIPPATPAFDLLNVKAVETPSALTISGDLGVSVEVANFLYATPGDALTKVGTFSFTGYTVPLTTPVLTLSPVSGARLELEARNGLPGSTYSIQTATNLAAPPGGWKRSGNGSFDGDGTSRQSISIQPGEIARFIRLQQP